MDKDLRIKELEEKNAQLEAELQSTKERLKRYTSPANSKEYYEKNKDKVTQKAKEKRQSIKVALVNLETPPQKPDEPPSPKSKLGKATFEQLVSLINGLDINEKSKQTYVSSLKRLHGIVKGDDYLDVIRNTESLIEKINNSKMDNGKDYSINTKKLLLQLIVYLIDVLNMKVNKKAIDAIHNQFDLYKIKSSDENAKKIESKETLTMTDYLKLVRSKFGEKGKMTILASLYNFMTVRDDFNNLIIVKTKKEFTADKEKNFIAIPMNGVCTIRINSYKTDKQYGVITEQLPLELSNLIRSYVLENSLVEGDSLFGNNIAIFISKQHKKIGVDGAINEIRHIKISDELGKMDLTAEDKLELANKMKHSPITQLKYNRLTKKVIE